MANLLLLTQGTDGDVHPFVHLGRVLHGRGHHVTVLTHVDYADLVLGTGLDFVALDPPDSRAQDAALGDGILTPQGAVAVMRSRLPLAVADYAKLRARCSAGETVLIWNHTSVLAADIAGEKLGLPLLPVFLSPSQLATVPLMKEILRATLGDDVNNIRAQVGLPPVRTWDDFMRYPAGGLALWPDWFAGPEAETLPGVIPVGFIVDRAAAIPDEVQAFLHGGEPPVLISGSTGAFGDVMRFFRTGLEACAQLGRRGIVAFRKREVLPTSLPEGIKWFPYLPFASVMPHTVAVIHHGGIGTCAQGLAAGVPHVMLAAGLDRPDNATRLQRLGVGQFLPLPKWDSDGVAEVLDQLATSPAVKRRCQELADLLSLRDPLTTACDRIEQLIRTGRLREAVPSRERAYLTPASSPEPKAGAGDLPEHLQSLSPERLELLARLLKQKAHQDSTNPAIPRQPRTAGRNSFPLSFAQQRLWFLDQLVPNHSFYNVASALRLAGRLNVAVLWQCMREIARRHEALRTTFAMVDGQPVQLIAPSVDVSLPVIDVCGLPAAQRQAEARRLALAEAQRPFDLARGPLVRTQLLRFGEEEHVLLLTMHHIVSDGWSVGVVIREIETLYPAYLNGLTSPLPALPAQYADYAVWQRQWLQGEMLETQLAYWRKQLADVSMLTLPTDRLRPALPTFRGATQAKQLPPRLTEELKTLSRQANVTLFMTLLAAFQTLLYRYTGQLDIALGSAIANRRWAEIEGLIGFFVNTLVMRTDLSGNPTFRDLLGRVREVCLGAYAHQDIPFEMLVEQLQPERDLSHQPLFQVAFVLQNAPVPRLQLAGLSVSVLEGVDQVSAKNDLTLFTLDGPHGLSLWFEYSTELFEATTIARWLGHFEQLLHGLVADPNQRIAQLPLLTGAERTRLLEEWSGVGAAPAPEACIHAWVEAQAARTPDAIAVTFETQHVTYQALNRRANQLARYLRQRGAGPETLVGICAERSVEMIVGVLGVLKAGAAYMPLDPAYPEERLVFMLEDSQVQLLLTQAHLRQHLPAHDSQTICLDADWPAIAQKPGQNPVSGATADNLAYMIYTSGSTGQPKGALLQHRGLCNFVAAKARIMQIGPDSRILQFSSLSFDASVEEIFVALVSGATLYLANRETLSSGLDLPQLLRDQAITAVILPPSLLQLLPADDLPALHTVVSAGESCPVEVARRWSQQHRFINGYGPTEATIGAILYLVDRVREDETNIPIGRPLDNVHVYLLDAHLQPVPIGVPGEVYIGGIGLARGYLRRPDLTAERFVPHPFSAEPAARLYKTGDLARYLPDGTIEFLGRLDQQIKIRGFRIELGEIESVLGQHSAVRECVVIACDTERVSTDKRLVTYVVPNPAQMAEDQAALEAEQIAHWQLLYEEAYRRPELGVDPEFNILGWNSSYTGQPIPGAEMREWVEQTVATVLALRPRRVLEIGCGSGLLLYRIAPHCVHYVGTDFSGVALEALRRQLARRTEPLPQVTLMQCSADDFHAIDVAAFDVVILNSVVQYFPSLDYLRQVLAGAARAVAPGGCIFVGDVRSRPLLRTFLASVEISKASAGAARAQLNQRVQQRLHVEEELCLDPVFFLELSQHLPGLSHVEVQPKRGYARSELTRFRYQVLLHVGAAGVELERQVWRDWPAPGLTLPELRQLLLETQPEALGLTRVPNARLLADAQTLAWLDDPEGNQTVGQLWQRLKELPADRAIDPEDLYALGDELAYTVDVSWARHGAEGTYDVVFRRGKGNRKAPVCFPPAAALPLEETYANNPLQGRIDRRLASQWRSFLLQRLPEYMVPSAFVLLESLPRTPNGKADRRALPQPDLARPALAQTYVAPRNSVEAVLADIWSQLLGVERIGVYDNFFELGGHSLLAVQVVSRLRQVFQVEFPLSQLFETPHIDGLAKALADCYGSLTVAEEVARLFQAIGQLSDDEAERMLSALDERPLNP